jgi:hypothetical protein
MTVIRGGGGKNATFTDRDAWNYAFNELARAGDRMEEPEERKLAAFVGLAWARTAYLMERAAILASPVDATRHTEEDTR